MKKWLPWRWRGTPPVRVGTTPLDPENTEVIFRRALRAIKIARIKATGRLDWIREAGTRARLYESVETVLFPLRERWDSFISVTDPELVEVLLGWAWELPEIKDAITRSFRETLPSPEIFSKMIISWIEGLPLKNIATTVGLDIDDMLHVHANVISYALQVAIEQGVAMLKRFVEADGNELSKYVINFSQHLRFGVDSEAARVLMENGLRHRRAAVTLSRSPELATLTDDQPQLILSTARQLLDDMERWLQSLGSLVLENSIEDLSRESA